MGGGEMASVADKDLEETYDNEERQEVNIDEGNNNEDIYTEEKQDRKEKRKVEDHGFENPQTKTREYFDSEAVDEKKEKDKKRKKDEKERSKEVETGKDKGKKYKGFVDKKDQKDKHKRAKEKDKKIHDIYGHAYGKEDEGKQLKEKKYKKDEKKKKDEERKDKKDNYIAEKLKKNLIKLDAKMEKILAKKEEYLQKLKEVEGRPVQDFSPVTSYDPVVASKLDTGSLERGMRSLNVSGSTREESIDMDKGKNSKEDTDMKNKDDTDKNGEDVKDEREKEVSSFPGVKSCRSREIMEEETGASKEDGKRKGKDENKAKFTIQKSTKKLAKLYDKLEHVLSDTKDYLQRLKEADRSSQQDAETWPQCQLPNKAKDKDMERLVKETLSLSVSNSMHDEKDESKASDKGRTAQDGQIVYPKLDEKEICGVGY